MKSSTPNTIRVSQCHGMGSSGFIVTRNVKVAITIPIIIPLTPLILKLIGYTVKLLVFNRLKKQYKNPKSAPRTVQNFIILLCL